MAELISSGEFHLDPERAREKLREFQLPSPDYHILELVKTASLLGASRFVYVPDTVSVVRFDGGPLSAGELGRLYAAAFADRRSIRNFALRHLAMAVYALEGGGATRIEIQVGGESPAAAIIVDGTLEVLTGDDLPEEKRVESGTRISVEFDLRRRALRFFRQVRSRGVVPETELLRQHCKYARMRVHVEREVISRGFSIDKEEEGLDVVRTYQVTLAYPNQTGEDFVEHGVVGIAVEEEASNKRLQVIQNGVLLADAFSPSPMANVQIQALVDSPVLNTNISQTQFVQDSAWHSMKLRVMARVLLGVRDYLVSRAGEDWIRGLLAYDLVQACLAEATGPHGDHQIRDVIVNSFRTLPFLTRLDPQTGQPGEPLTVAEALVDGRVYFVQESTWWSIEEGRRDLIREELFQDLPVVLWRRNPTIQVNGDRQVLEFFRHYAEEARTVIDVPSTLTTPHWAVRQLRRRDENEEKVIVSSGLSLEPEESEPRAPAAEMPATEVTKQAEKPVAKELKTPSATPEEAERQILSLASHPRFSRFHWTDGDGSRIVYRDGPKLAIDRNDPTIRAALDDPEDIFARAFAAASVRSEATRLHNEVTNRPSNSAVLAREKRSFLRVVTRALDRG